MITHGPVPLQTPPLSAQPAKVEPGSGAALKVTSWPWMNSWVQLSVQSTPVGVDVTVPAPLRKLVTFTVCV
jgi:hypothetical protein